MIAVCIILYVSTLARARQVVEPCVNQISSIKTNSASLMVLLRRDFYWCNICRKAGVSLLQLSNSLLSFMDGSWLLDCKFRSRFRYYSPARGLPQQCSREGASSQQPRSVLRPRRAPRRGVRISVTNWLRYYLLELTEDFAHIDQQCERFVLLHATFYSRNQFTHSTISLQVFSFFFSSSFDKLIN